LPAFRRQLIYGVAATVTGVYGTPAPGSTFSRVAPYYVATRVIIVLRSRNF